MKKLNRRQWLRTAGVTSAVVATSKLSHATDLSSTIPHAATNGPVRLTSNENPFAPSKLTKDAMREAFDICFRYPPSHYGVLIDKLAKKYGVTNDHILLTSGSNEGLRVVGATYGMTGGEILTAQPTYKALLSYAEEFGAYVNAVPLTDELKFDLDEIEKRVNTNTQLVFLCNPNNPTGTLLNPTKVQDFCETVSDRTIVFSDEAYYDYVTDKNYPSMIPLVKEGKNVIVSKTFSKVYGLAGVRVGYLIARPDIIDRLRPKVMSYVNMMGVYGAAAALDDATFYDYSLKMNTKARAHIYTVCKDIGLEYVESHTNFVFFKTGRDISTFQKQMEENGVLVGRPFPPLTDWCRVSTGTMEDMLAWEKAMHKVFG